MEKDFKGCGREGIYLVLKIIILILGLIGTYVGGNVQGKIHTENVCANLIDSMVVSVSSQPIPATNITHYITPMKVDLNTINNNEYKLILSKTEVWGAK